MKKQKVTIHDIARELNTTASTVSRALQDHPRISKATKEAVLELAQRLNYQPNSLASSLRKGKGNTIGIIIPRIDRQFFASIIRGIEDVASKAGYNVMICQSYDSQEREKAIIENLTNGKVDGLLVSLAAGSEDLSHFKLVQSKGLPLIFFDRVPLNMEANKVEVDDYTGAFKAVEHLILQGCRRIVHFCGPHHVSIYKNRFEGYKAALAHYNITYDPQLIFEGVITRELGEKAAIEIAQIKPLPDGLFSSGDYSALGAILKFKQLGINIPGDIAVVGFANESFDDILSPGLSSVDQRSIEMGHSVANLFLEVVNETQASISSKRIVLDVDLHVRGSSLK